jgi:hypothetical protein
MRPDGMQKRAVAATRGRSRGASALRWERTHRVTLGVTLCLLSLAIPRSVRAAAGFRVLSGVGYDSNVLEGLERKNRLDDAFLRLQAEARLSTRALPGSARAELLGRGLLESFDRFPREDRRQGEVVGSIGLSDPRGVRTIALEAGLRGRDYPDSALRNHWRAWGGLTTSVPVGPRGVLTGRLSIWSLDFHSTRRRDRSGGSLDLSYVHPMVERVVLSGGLELGSVYHGFKSLQFDPEAENTGVAGTLYGPDREDHTRFVHLDIRRVGRVLMRLQYGYRVQSSNSIDGETRRGEVSWLFSSKLPYGVTGQCYGNWGRKRYTNPHLSQILVVRLDNIEASEDDNTIALRALRTLTGDLRADLRAGWYRNESYLISQYYNKTVFSAGLSWETGAGSGN